MYSQRPFEWYMTRLPKLEISWRRGKQFTSPVTLGGRHNYYCRTDIDKARAISWGTDRQTRFRNPHMETCRCTKNFNSKLGVSIQFQYTCPNTIKFKHASRFKEGLNQSLWKWMYFVIKLCLHITHKTKIQSRHREPFLQQQTGS